VPEVDARLIEVQRLEGGSFSLELTASASSNSQPSHGRGRGAALLAGQVVRPSDLVLLCPVVDACDDDDGRCPDRRNHSRNHPEGAGVASEGEQGDYYYDRGGSATAANAAAAQDKNVDANDSAALNHCVWTEVRLPAIRSHSSRAFLETHPPSSSYQHSHAIHLGGGLGARGGRHFRHGA
jgi:hypothetical protein